MSAGPRTLLQNNTLAPDGMESLNPSIGDFQHVGPADLYHVLNGNNHNDVQSIRVLEYDEQPQGNL